MTHLICLHIYERYVRGKNDRFPAHRCQKCCKINSQRGVSLHWNSDCIPIQSFAWNLKNKINIGPNRPVLPGFPETLFSALSGAAITLLHGTHPGGRKVLHIVMMPHCCVWRSQAWENHPPSIGWFIKRYATVGENCEAGTSLKDCLFAEAILLDDWLKIVSLPEIMMSLEGDKRRHSLATQYGFPTDDWSCELVNLLCLG